MKAIKFDEQKVTNCIQAYYDQHGKYPYLIMNQNTADILPPQMTYNTGMGVIYGGNSNTTIAIKDTKPEKITIDNEQYTRDIAVVKSLYVWHNCKVMIDGDLEFGEVHIG